MSKIYLFGPMRGVSQKNKTAFAEARKTLRDMGHEVFCPSEFSESWRVTDLRECLKWDLAWILKEAEMLVGLPGWKTSRGSLTEVALAWAIGIPVYEYELFSQRKLKEVKYRAVPDWW